MEQIILGKVRVQLFSADIIRIECSKNGKFCDENTFFIPNKTNYENNEVAYTQENGVICFGDYELYIPENAKSLVGVRLDKNGEKIYTYRKLKNGGELPPLTKHRKFLQYPIRHGLFCPKGATRKVQKANTR